MSTRFAARDAACWHALSVAEVAERLRTDAGTGLSAVEAGRRLAHAGRNELAPARTEPWWAEALESLGEPLVLLLAAVAGLYALFGQVADALTIGAVIVAVAGVETYTELRARHAIGALAALAAPEATVVRAGTPRTIPAWQVVPGDLVALGAGHRIPADVRLVRTTALRMDESSLTGESEPVGKRADAVLAPATPELDRVTIAFGGTLVTAGRGWGLVVATGGGTALGRAAALARAARPPLTPLQRQLRALSRALLWIALGTSVLVPTLAILLGAQPWRDAVLAGLTLAFATIPEELPILITVVLGRGAYRLARDRAIVRRLEAAETLGSITVLGTDKTGTLTENRMRVAAVLAGGAVYQVHDSMQTVAGRRTLEEAAVAAQVHVVPTADGGTRMLGDPTDAALVEGARVAGVLGTRETARVLAERPFDEMSRSAAVLYEHGGGVRRLVVIGAPEAVFARCTGVQEENTAHALDAARRDALADGVAELAAAGMRVIAVAVREVAREGTDALTRPRADACTLPFEDALTLLGLVALHDPPRPEAAAAIRALGEAGVRVVMITGDHPATARAIARQVGIPAGEVATGAEVDAASEPALAALVRHVSVFARTSPAQKLRLVRALQATGEIVAVTGDGVNDAPALRQAAIGIAMGERGSDVARESADLILADDNMATVAGAVRAGRVLSDNLRRAVRFYLAAKVALVLATLAAVLARWPIPFAPIQIIVLELFMDLGASTTFVAEPAEADVMRQPPRHTGAPFVDRAMVVGIAGGGLALATAVLVPYLWASARGLGTDAARTAAFVAWMIGHLVLAAGMRARQPGSRSVPRVTLPFALWALGVVVLLAAAAVVPAVAARLALVPLPIEGWAVVVTSALLVPAVWCRVRQPAAHQRTAR